VHVPGECPLLLLSCVRLPLVLTVETFRPSPGVGVSQAFPATGPGGRGGPSRAKKARAREQMRARDALERRRWKQERDGLPREPSPETPDDDDDDDEDDDMAARLGLSPDLRLGQGSSSQPPSGLAPSVSGAGISGSRSEEQGQAEGVLDPLAEVVEVDPPVPQDHCPCWLHKRLILRSSCLRLGGPSLWRPGRPRQGWCRSRQRGKPW
jgi:hypothetical protein